ncbi:HepT-like ribonuclease domain-containing protein [Carnobacterium alterfunditum]|uniref:HepT-like ribonuclease domain-containing protein n=1 Tax=Carnobacterium alterfunditum TaxID=28230 RepID=UPI003593A933
MTKRELKDYLEDILETLLIIETFTEDLTFDSFVNDKKTLFAINHAIERIGEATKNIPENIRVKYPHIKWKGLTGMRDKIIHYYFGINYQIVWDTIKKDLPTLKPVIKDILKSFNTSV